MDNKIGLLGCWTGHKGEGGTDLGGLKHECNERAQLDIPKQLIKI